MNDWSQEHRPKRHVVQRSFEALEQRDVRGLARWRDESGVSSMLSDALGGSRAPFIHALAGPPGPDLQRLLLDWTTRFAERVHQGWTPTWVLDWWLERPRVWVEGEVRQRLGNGIVKSLHAGFRCGGSEAFDRLALDAMFAASVLAALDACENYLPTEPVEPWVRGVAFHTARDFARAEERRRLQLPRADLDPDRVSGRAADGLALVDMADERAWVVARAMGGTTLRGEQVIVSSILDGTRSAESIGEELSISVKRVYKRTAAARARLREAMDRLRGS